MVKRTEHPTQFTHCLPPSVPSKSGLIFIYIHRSVDDSILTLFWLVVHKCNSLKLNPPQSCQQVKPNFRIQICAVVLFNLIQLWRADEIQLAHRTQFVQVCQYCRMTC